MTNGVPSQRSVLFWWTVGSAVFAIACTSPVDRAYDATARSDIRNAMSAEEAYFRDTRTYASHALATGAFTTSTGVSISASAASTGGYSVTASHSSTGNTFWVEVGTGSTMEGKVQAN